MCNAAAASLRYSELAQRNATGTKQRRVGFNASAEQLSLPFVLKARRSECAVNLRQL